MCGIFMSLSASAPVPPGTDTQQHLRNRGPDCSERVDIKLSRDTDKLQGTSEALHMVFFSSVLALRGQHVVHQPFSKEDQGSILCWNGEAWKVDHSVVSGNDTELIFNLLNRATLGITTGGEAEAHNKVLEAASLIHGPYAFVFYDAPRRRIYFGRDRLGRRSLLRTSDADTDLMLSSVCSRAGGEDWIEVEADGLYFVQLFDHDHALSGATLVEDHEAYKLYHVPHSSSGEVDPISSSMSIHHFTLNRQLPQSSANQDSSITRHSAAKLQTCLRTSLFLRLRSLNEGAHQTVVEKDIGYPSRLAVLFSGGLDCTVLARLAHDMLPLTEPIDLLNVAFENPRIHKSCEISGLLNSPYELCPDRVTGRTSLAELRSVCPGRTWRFVEINIPYTETLEHRAQVMTLMYPHNTEMDLSISFALYFASRGVGQAKLSDDDHLLPYKSPAKVQLSGLGADELFGGYQRHALAFSRLGFEGLLDELELDFRRLGKRNLGRDDRVISHWGKEVRFPYLDEDVISWALAAPVWEKCGFGQKAAINSGTGDIEIEPGKRVLRLLAWDLGLAGAAKQKKRAVSWICSLLVGSTDFQIQFGARTAKMETGKTKGTQAVSR